ncbi:helix-turn-helix transcriptional regulator [Sodalis endosymbiont of Spalangia cameroni]|uniref:helix-turn-helix domain-containing protein n=1 Tax=Sodalis praecaptivus TaxID=1239307 RepID=UPI0031FA2467
MKKKPHDFPASCKEGEKRLISGIGTRCKGRRSQLGISRNIIAQRINVSLSTLQAWENQEREPSASDIILLADALDVAPSWLLIGQAESDQVGTKNQSEAYIQETFNNYESQADLVLKSLSKEQKEALVEAILQVGVSGIMSALSKAELMATFSMLSDAEKERLMRLYEQIKKGASEEGEVASKDSLASERKRAV